MSESEGKSIEELEKKLNELKRRIEKLKGEERAE